MNDEDIGRYLYRLEAKLLKESKVRVSLSHSWANSFPAKPGVYIAYKGKVIVYVGETGNVRGRMRDLLDSRHHTLRRHIGKSNFSNLKGYRDATSKNKFPSHIENKVNLWIKKNILIAAVIIRLGRKELEERMVKKFVPSYNKKGERVSA